MSSSRARRIVVVVALAVVIGALVALALRDDAATRAVPSGSAATGAASTTTVPATTTTSAPSATQCARYRSVRRSADRVAPLLGQAFGAMLVDPRDFNWPAFSARFSAALRRLDRSLAAAAPESPAIVRRDLVGVRRAIGTGLDSLRGAHNVSDFVRAMDVAQNSDEGILDDGIDHLDSASDALGKSCGFALAPSWDAVFEALSVEGE